MARRRGGVTPRMEKHIDISVLPVTANNSVVDSFQLEGGEEECQIKRIVLSCSEHGTTFGCRVKLGLFQKVPGITDFSDDTVIYSYSFRNQQLINETTTVRVPQGWYIGILMTNNDPALDADTSRLIQLNYLSLG